MIEISSKNLYFFRRKIKAWHKEHSFKYPWRTTKNKWHALVAEIMLQRTNAEQVIPIYLNFTKKYETAGYFLKKIQKEKADIFENLGLRWRNKLLIETAKAIDKNGFPETKEDLIKTPGIGEYIASAYLSFHLDKRAIIIDSNIVRLYGRFFGFKYDEETRRKKWFIELAQKITPQKDVRDFNYSLLDFSRTICTFKPLCEECNIRGKCLFNKSQGVGPVS